MNRHFVISLTIVVVAAGGACRRAPAATPYYDPATGALQRIDLDYDLDGRVDVRTFMKNGRAERLEGDADGDGRLDRWEEYRADGSLERIGGSRSRDGHVDTWAYPAASEVRVEMSTRGDGVIDRREFFHKHVLRRTESDTNGDGVMDTWEEYADGRLAVWLVDTTQRLGRPTRRLVYHGDSAPVIEVDEEGSGHFTPVALADVPRAQDGDDAR